MRLHEDLRSPFNGDLCSVDFVVSVCDFSLCKVLDVPVRACIRPKPHDVSLLMVCGRRRWYVLRCRYATQTLRSQHGPSKLNSCTEVCVCKWQLSHISHISLLLPAEMIAGRLLLMLKAFVLCMEFVGIGMIHRSQGLTAPKIRQALHLTARPCRNCRMSVPSSRLSLEQVGTIAAQRSRLTH